MGIVFASRLEGFLTAWDFWLADLAIYLGWLPGWCLWLARLIVGLAALDRWADWLSDYFIAG
jgi:hypothetical protein